MVGLEIATFFPAGVLGYLWARSDEHLAGHVFLFRLALPVLLTGFLINVVFRYLIPARCPESNCEGPCFPKGKKPIIYRCRACGFEEVTRVSVGSGEHDPHSDF